MKASFRNIQPQLSENQDVRQDLQILRDQKTGELHYKNTNGEATLKVINSDGKVVFDGPVNTKDQKSKVPAEAMKWLDKVNIKVEEVNIKVKPPAIN